MHENVPGYDPQSNMHAEVVVKLLKEMVRTMRSNLEGELGFRVSPRHTLVAWLALHAANTLNRMIKGHDGIRAQQGGRGKPLRTI